MTIRPRVACICGSTRQRDDITELNRRLTMEGLVVLAPSVFGHSGDPITADEKARLDALHLHKIDMADEVYAISKPDGSWGESTTREIDYALATGKRVVHVNQGRKEQT